MCADFWDLFQDFFLKFFSFFFELVKNLCYFYDKIEEKDQDHWLPQLANIISRIFKVANLRTSTLGKFIHQNSTKGGVEFFRDFLPKFPTLHCLSECL